MSLTNVLTTTVLVLAAVTLAVLAAMVVARLVRLTGERRRSRLAEAGTGLLVRVADGSGDQEAVRQLAEMDARVWKALEPTALHLLDVISGKALTDLIGLFERRGAVAAACRNTHSRSGVRRARAAHDLGRFRHRPAVPELCRLLTEADADVRHCAARALGRIADPAAAPHLLAALGGTRPIPVSVVAHALLRLEGGDTTALRAGLKDRNPRVRAVAAEVLGRCGAHETLLDLVTVLEADEAVDVRVRAIGALTRLGLPQAVPPLLEATYAAEPMVRAAAARALGKLPDTRSVAQLTTLLADPVHEVAHEAAQALPGLGAAGLAALEQAAADPSSQAAAVRARNALALAALGSPHRRGPASASRTEAP